MLTGWISKPIGKWLQPLKSKLQILWFSSKILTLLLTGCMSLQTAGCCCCSQIGIWHNTSCYMNNRLVILLVFFLLSTATTWETSNMLILVVSKALFIFFICTIELHCCLKTIKNTSMSHTVAWHTHKCTKSGLINKYTILLSFVW